MLNKNYLILILLILGACRLGDEQVLKEDPTGGTSGFLSIPKVISAGSPRITEINADALQVVPARGKPLQRVQKNVQPAVNNSRPARQPVQININAPLPVFTPGRNGVPDPKRIAAVGRTLAVGYPDLVPALPPDFRDNAIYNIQVLEVEQGLSSSSYLSILQDRRGHLWLGSVNGGLTRYDGRYFAHFTTRQGLTDDRIYSILEDRHGNLWIGMDNYGGITRYDGQTFTHFGAEEGITSRVIYDILEDQTGDLWFGTESEGVIRYDGSQFTFYTADEGLGANDIFSVAQDREGKLWFGTESAGATSFDGQSFTRYPQIGDTVDVVADIIQDKRGNMWFGTVRNGVYQFDGTNLWQYTMEQGLSNNTVLAIQEDDQAGVWFGTRDGGACRFDGQNFTHFGVEEGMSTNTILTLGKDRWGNIWLGTEGGGICKFTPGSFRHITQKQGLKNNSVRAIVEDHQGIFWLGTQRGDISRYDGQQFEHFKLQDIGSSWIISGLEDHQNRLWFGTFGGGLIQYDPADKQFTQFSETEGLSRKNVERILEDRQGNLWIGTFEGGVNKFDGTHFTHFSENDGLAGNSVISLLEDRKGNLWFGTFRNGLCRYDGERFVTYTTAQGLSNNTIRVIFEDSQGFLWFGTEGGGLNRFDGKHFAHYQLKDGLGDNHIQSIHEDQQGNFWFATIDGLYHATLNHGGGVADSLESPPPIMALLEYGRADGLKAEDFLANSSLLDRSNRLWLGTEKGLTTRQLSEHTTLTDPPLVYLSQLNLNQQFVDYSDTVELKDLGLSTSGVEPFNNYPIKPALPHKFNSLTFYFSALDASQAYKPVFQYRLKGYDRSWNVPTKETYVDYRNLPAGRYNFELRSIGNSGVWSKPLSYAFSVLPPWWLSWWAKTLYCLLFLAGLLAIRRYNLQRRRKKQLAVIERARLEEKSKQAETIAAQARELEKSLQELKERNAEITAARDQLIVQEKLASLGNLTAGIAHEIKNPLNFIINFAEDSGELNAEIIEMIMAARNDLPPETYAELLELLGDNQNNSKAIEENGRKIDRIVRSMMDHTRGKETDWQPVSLNELLDENINLAYHSYRAGNLAFNVDIQRHYAAPLPTVKVHALQIGRVLLNIISNALYAISEKQKKMVNYQPKLEVGTRKIDNAVEVFIRDNGPGIPPDILKEIFTPFFTTKPTGQGNTGLGLSISYDIIVKEHRGQLEVDSEPGQFTEFRIVLPLNGSLGREA